MYCKQCTNELSNDTKFCNKCGFPVAALVLPASTLRRLSNHLLDYVFIFILVFVFSFLSKLSSGVVSTVFSIFSTIIFFVYYLVCESIWQRTLGKVITKTKVVDREGNKPGFLKILGRSLVRYIPFEPFSFLFGGYPIGWHDSLSKTLVVSKDMTSEKVREMDFVQIRKQKSNSVAVTIILVFVIGIVTIAIIGIFSSVVLVSLNTAKVKGSDAVVRANLSNFTATAELYSYSNNNSYSGVCFNPQALSLLKSASRAGTQDQNEFGYVCNDSEKKYAVSEPLKSGGYLCVDSSTNLITPMNTALGTRTACL